MNQRLQSKKRTIYFPVLGKRYPPTSIILHVPYKYTATCNRLYQFDTYQPPMYTIHYDTRHLENIS